MKWRVETVSGEVYEVEARDNYEADLIATQIANEKGFAVVSMSKQNLGRPVVTVSPLNNLKAA